MREGRADFRSEAEPKGTASRGWRCSDTMVTGRVKRVWLEVKDEKASWRSCEAK